MKKIHQQEEKTNSKNTANTEMMQSEKTQTLKTNATKNATFNTTEVNTVEVSPMLKRIWKCIWNFFSLFFSFDAFVFRMCVISVFAKCLLLIYLFYLSVAHVFICSTFLLLHLFLNFMCF